MSLPEVVLQIADEMESTAKQSEDPKSLYNGLLSHAKMLRMAVKASEIKAADPIVSRLPADKAQRLIAKRAEQELEYRAQAQEGGSRMVVIQGGIDDGTMVPIPGHMPAGTRTNIGGSVYELRTDGSLHHVPEVVKTENKRIIT